MPVTSRTVIFVARTAIFVMISPDRAEDSFTVDDVDRENADVHTAWLRSGNSDSRRYAAPRPHRAAMWRRKMTRQEENILIRRKTQQRMPGGARLFRLDAEVRVPVRLVHLDRVMQHIAAEN